MGVDKGMATVTAEDHGEFFQSMTMSMVDDSFKWSLINIYGPAHDDRKREFLEELVTKVQGTDVPLIMGGHFNLVRKVEEKSSGNVNTNLMDAFNDMINTYSLERTTQDRKQRYMVK
jgi:hypothetical protein